MKSLEYSEAFAAHAGASLRNIHHCKLCSYYTTSFFLLMNHVRYHKSVTLFNCESSPIENYYCNNCDFQTELTVLLKKHVARLHSIKRGDEDLSNSVFTIYEYVCEKCSFATNLSLKRLQHSITCLETEEKLLTVSTANDAEQYIFACDECESKSRYKHCLKRHKYSIHLNEYQISWYHCMKCSYKSKQKSHLQIYVDCKHVNEQDEQDIKWYKCQKCTFKSKLNCNLKQHMKLQHVDEKDIKWYECEKCPFKSKTKNYLKNHINARHLDEKDVKWYICNRCSFKSKYLSSLHTHINIHCLKQ